MKRREEQEAKRAIAALKKKQDQEAKKKQQEEAKRRSKQEGQVDMCPRRKESTCLMSSDEAVLLHLYFSDFLAET